MKWLHEGFQPKMKKNKHKNIKIGQKKPKQIVKVQHARICWVKEDKALRTWTKYTSTRFGWKRIIYYEESAPLLQQGDWIAWLTCTNLELLESCTLFNFPSYFILLGKFSVHFSCRLSLSSKLFRTFYRVAPSSIMHGWCLIVCSSTGKDAWRKNMKQSNQNR